MARMLCWRVIRIIHRKVALQQGGNPPIVRLHHMVTEEKKIMLLGLSLPQPTQVQDSPVIITS